MPFISNYNNKNKIIDDGNTEMKHLLRKTKNMVLDILLIQNGTSIVDVLNKPSSDDLETDFHELVEQKIVNNELLKQKLEEEKRELESNNLKKKSNPNSPNNSNNSINKSSNEMSKSANEIDKSTNTMSKSTGSVNKSQNELESRNNLAKTKSISFTQLKESTFAEYKNLAKENLEKLEGYHDIKKENDYQTLLNIITKVYIYIHL